MKRILILGASGMAGHIITLYLEETGKYKIFNLCHKDALNTKSILCDVTDLKKLKQILDKIRPDIIINCIGILNDKSDDDIIKTIYINTFLPKWLEHYYQATNCKIIQLSTDCVFKGTKGNYRENDVKDEDNIYGLSKNLGEIDNSKDFTIRTSIIGPELKTGKGLFDWFMRQTKEVNGYTNVYWSGITTLELAHIVDEAISQDITGLYNITQKGKISKYKLLQLVKDVFNKDDILIHQDSSKKSDKSLVTNRTDFNYKISDYRTMLLKLKDWMREHIKFYQSYFQDEIKNSRFKGKIKKH